ncbi:acyl carrier protein [Duganella callida]|uniref:Acyl carrier protein n=1 Tax=Duganella callida TaxID=2561932 RepID=A0A4Y9SX79_9BURK|nr:acyl carrier protein [Duganella callida]TFW31232.1 acyl carrier protein [Duganella callida]
MEIAKIAQLAAKVLYLEDEPLDVSKSLFQTYHMSRLDYVDFASELQLASGKQFDPDQLWPINGMLNQPALYQAGGWTEAGRAALARLFDGHAEIPAGAAPATLQGMFTVEYVAHRLRAL